MLHMIPIRPCDIADCTRHLSVAMHLQAFLAFLWPKTYAKFEYDWHKASSILAKNYEAPRFTSVSASWVPVDLALEKNSDENEVYMELLRADEARVEQTRYVQEIQIGKHKRTLAVALAQADQFRRLLKSVEREGIRRPVLLVDVAGFDLPYRLYRFDGHHRAICAKFLGLETVPAFIFKVTSPGLPGPDGTRAEFG